LGNGDGTFALTNYSFGLSNSVVSQVAADFNGDGKLDMATVSTPYNNLTVLLQSTGAIPTPDFSIAPAIPSMSLQAGATATYDLQA
jgi:hypothetical protein